MSVEIGAQCRQEFVGFLVLDLLREACEIGLDAVLLSRTDAKKFFAGPGSPP
jgi:hypothetical protein